MLNEGIDVFSPQKNSWSSSVTQQLTKQSVLGLFSNDVPAIHLSHFAEPNECSSLHHELTKLGFESYLEVEPKIGRIGTTQYEAINEGKEWYFEKARTELQKQQFAFSHSFNPLARLISLLRSQLPDYTVAIARENNESYFAGLVRQIDRRALIHADYAPYDGAGWKIGSIKAQLAWNLCVVAPDSGGECVVYNKPWNVLTDEQYRTPGSYGYEPSVIAGMKRYQLALSQGSSYLFNSRNFHEVLPCMGDRVTVSCFLGLTDDKQILIWS